MLVIQNPLVGPFGLMLFNQQYLLHVSCVLAITVLAAIYTIVIGDLNPSVNVIHNMIYVFFTTLTIPDIYF